MYYYHMTALDKLPSIAVRGLIPQNGDNGKLIGEEKVKVFFSEGFEGAVALYVDFDVVFNKIRKAQIKIADEFVRKNLLESKSLSDFLGEGVYLQFDGNGIPLISICQKNRIKTENEIKTEYCLPIGSDYLNRQSATFLFSENINTA